MSDTKTPTVAPSQVTRPTLAAVRTFLQAFIPGLLTALVVIPAILDAILAEDSLPPQVRAWLVGAAAVVAAVAGVIARIMAIPAVNEWLRSLGIGVPSTRILTPAGKPDVVEVGTSTVKSPGKPAEDALVVEPVGDALD